MLAALLAAVSTPALAQTVAITGGKLVIGDGSAPIENGTVLVQNGTLRQGALEESNVDITAELVNMITAQRVYQANAQTIKTQDAVLQTLVNLR